MLEEISIENQATYTGEAQALAGLKQVNFIFGANGSGKTTISRVIGEPSAYPGCRLSWKNGREVERLVYNSDFAERNFASEMPGIFTLGEAEVETLTKIGEGKETVRKIQDDLDGLTVTLGSADNSSGKRAELRDLRSAFEEKCWQIKTSHDTHFRDAFTGYRNSRSSFCDKILSEQQSNTAKLVPIDDLKQRALTVFAKGLESVPTLPVLDAAALIDLEQTPVLAKKVVGKEDIDIAALIRRLGNSDWVKQGLGYISAGGAQCPFCQQDIDADLFAKLNAYFDETYLGDIAAIDKVRDVYETYSDDVLGRLEALLASGSSHMDAAALRADVDRLAARIDLNKRQLERKRKEPSVSVKLEGLAGLVAPIADAISKANTSIGKHNSLVGNLAAEKVTLTAEIWKCLLDESSEIIGEFVRAKSALDKAIAGLTKGIDAKTTALGTAKAALADLEKSITSVQPTVNDINAILTSFGFTSFQLATAGEQENLYAIVRSDGSNAAKTLSEGERSFITFLYFFHLIRGSTSASGLNVERVVVFDDPVSSLDSDVLFIVSALIRGIVAEACKGDGLIKQVFLLTHNIYFHKEVSFDLKRQDVCRVHETFWIVRKVKERSVVQGYGYNPIKTSYELLWQEVREPTRSRMTIQNTLRRIIEYYFKILGNVDKDDIIAKFIGKDKQVCAALFSWVNDGSHNFSDDLYISADEGLIERYLDVFKRIFVNTNHMAHYEMMMGPEAPAHAETDPEPAEAVATIAVVSEPEAASS